MRFRIENLFSSFLFIPLVFVFILDGVDGLELERGFFGFYTPCITPSIALFPSYLSYLLYSELGSYGMGLVGSINGDGMQV